MAQQNQQVPIQDQMQVPSTAINAPVFMPDPSLLPPTGDPYQGLVTLLQQLQGQQYNPPQQGKLQQILGALASGASILASNDPGGTLGNQLNARLQVQQNRENQERARQTQLQTAMIQGMLEKSRGANEAQTRTREMRLQGALQTEAGVQATAQQAAVDLNRADIKLKEMASTEDFLNRTMDQRAIRNRMESPEIYNQSLQLAQQIAHYVPKTSPEVATKLAQKLTGQDLNSISMEENLLYNRYNVAKHEDWKKDKALKEAVAKGEIDKNEAEARYYQVLAGQGGSKTDPILANAADEYAKRAFSPAVKLKNGQIVSSIDLPKYGMSGQFNTTQPTEEETFKFQQEQLKSFTKLNQDMRSNVNNVNTTMPGQPTTIQGQVGNDPILNLIKEYAQTHSREETLKQFVSSTIAPELKQKYIQLITNNFEEIKGQMVPATKTQKLNKVPPGVRVNDILNIKR